LLKVQDNKKTLIKQWENLSSAKALVFTVHCDQLVSYYEDDNTITVFYGFLDQDYQGKSAAEYVSNKIKQSGADGLNHCYGSFIVIHFDHEAKKFMLANDALGDFALHYVTEGNVVNISDLPQALLTAKNSTINQERILHFFAVSKPQNNCCFYEQITQLNPGQFLTIDENMTDIKQYYFPPINVNYKSQSVEKLAEQFKSLMQSVIDYQTKGQDRIGVMMSGGMDSTFIAANGQKSGKNIHTFSYVFPTMPQANETIWLDAFRNKGFEMNTFTGESHWPLKYPWPVSLNAPVSNPYRHLKSVIYKNAENKKIQYLLSGVFADHLYTGYIYWMVDLFKRKPLLAIKSFYSISKQHGFKTGLRQIAPAKWSAKLKFKAPWLNKEANEQFQQSIKSLQPHKHPHPQQFALTYGLTTAQSVWLDHEYSFQHNLFVRHPFRDRRIVEFLMAIPAWVLGDYNLPKKFVRESSKDLLPDAIIRRTKTSTLEPLFVKGVLDKELEKVKGVLYDQSSQWHHYIDKKIVDDLLKNPQKNHKDLNYVVLWQCINFELWQKRLKNL